MIVDVDALAVEFVVFFELSKIRAIGVFFT